MYICEPRRTWIPYQVAFISHRNDNAANQTGVPSKLLELQGIRPCSSVYFLRISDSFIQYCVTIRAGIITDALHLEALPK